MDTVRSRLGWVWQVFCWVLILASFSVLIAAVAVPRLSGSTPYTILTGSMKATYPAGTLVVTRPIDADKLQAGDVITYQLESGKPEVVTHRIIAVSSNLKGETLFLTKGDSNDAADENLVRAVQVRGKLWYSVPYVGYASSLMSTDQRWKINYIIAGILALYSLWSFATAFRERRKNKDDANSPPEEPNDGENDQTVKPKSHRMLGYPFVVAVIFSALSVLVASAIIPSGAYWRSNLTLPGTTLTVGNLPTSLYCQVINTGTGNPEAGASCNTTLAAAGCSGSWPTGSNIYVNFHIAGVSINAGNNYGNNLRVKFKANLQALGCNPPGLNWTGSPGPGIQAGSSINLVPGYQCSTLPIVEGSIQYYTAANPSVYMGQLVFNKTTGPVTCII